MSYSSQFGSGPRPFNTGSNWSTLADSVVQLIQIATAVASARLMEEPGARGMMERGRILSFAQSPKLAERSRTAFDASVKSVIAEYQGLTECLVRVNNALHFTGEQARSFSLEDAVAANAPFDCEPFDQIRSEIEIHLSKAAMLHAQIVCSTMTIVNNIHHAYICGPRIPQFCDDPVGQESPYGYPSGKTGPIGAPVGQGTQNEPPPATPGPAGDPVEENTYTGSEPRDKGNTRSRK